MAYAPLPGRRVPYHITGIGWDNTTRDGASAWTQLTPTELSELNDEDETYVKDVYDNYVTARLVVAFGMPVDVTGLHFQGGTTSSWTLYTSTDTTDGQDGNWTDRGAYAPNGAGYVWRSQIDSVDYPACTGMRLYAAYGGAATRRYYQDFHVYGNYTFSGLNVWDDTLDQTIGNSFLDFGDVIRGYAHVRTFRVKNTSNKTANDVVVSTSVPVDTSPTVASQITYSSGGAYTSSINIGSLAPGAISGVLTMKYDIPTNANTGTYAGRINLTATSWT